MGQPFVGEIRMFAGNFAPVGWMLCQGQILAISEYETLFNLIGTTYGGDGQNTFGLPDLQGRVPVHQGTLSGGGTYTVGSNGGVETVTLTTNQIPSHTHPAVADNNPVTTTATDPTSNFYGNTGTTEFYSVHTAALKTLESPPSQGGSQPHENHQPFLALNFIISMFGIYPSTT
ncbi:MAG TPA: tail fiber protein [Candidatus Baltobacteraceae bacterium]|nr:tail fiber protein [Candidatus Baltobacteraceae bacterium]